LLKKKTKTDAADSTADADILDTILVEQFCPPVRQATFEFPAGLINKDETPKQAALRELKEEMGYVSSTASTMPRTVSRAVCMSSWSMWTWITPTILIHRLSQTWASISKSVEVSLKEGFQTLLDKESSPMAIQVLYLFAMGLEIGKSINNA
jgi:8-oxo-dGTP pyrophosphatase MutT (NUDIX family)